MQEAQVFASFMDYGALGLCFVQLGVIVWAFKLWAKTSADTNRVIEANTSAVVELRHEINDIKSDQAQSLRNIQTLKDLMLTRSCVARDGNKTNA